MGIWSVQGLPSNSRPDVIRPNFQWLTVAGSTITLTRCHTLLFLLVFLHGSSLSISQGTISRRIEKKQNIIGRRQPYLVPRNNNLHFSISASLEPSELLTPVLHMQHRIMDFHNLCHILPGAISHRSDIVTLWQNNLAGIRVKLRKVLYNLPINYSSRGAYVAAVSCALSSSSGLCMEATPRGLYT